MRWEPRLRRARPAARATRRSRSPSPIFVDGLLRPTKTTFSFFPPRTICHGCGGASMLPAPGAQCTRTVTSVPPALVLGRREHHTRAHAAAPKTLTVLLFCVQAHGLVSPPVNLNVWSEVVRRPAPSASVARAHACTCALHPPLPVLLRGMLPRPRGCAQTPAFCAGDARRLHQERENVLDRSAARGSRWYHADRHEADTVYVHLPRARPHARTHVRLYAHT